MLCLFALARMPLCRGRPERGVQARARPNSSRVPRMAGHTLPEMKCQFIPRARSGRYSVWLRRTPSLVEQGPTAFTVVGSVVTSTSWLELLAANLHFKSETGFFTLTLMLPSELPLIRASLIDRQKRSGLTNFWMDFDSSSLICFWSLSV